MATTGSTKALFLLPLLLLVIAANIEVALGSGKMTIEFISFINKQNGGKGRVKNGDCCDPGCFSKCDHYFRVCVDSLDSDDTVHPCIYYKGNNTAPIKNHDIIDFKTDSKDVSMNKPLVIPMRNLERDVSIKIAVYEDDTDFDEDVDFLRLDLNKDGRNLMGPDDPRVFDIKGRTTLKVRVLFECDKDYYGINCNALCRAPVTGQHYTCNRNTGAKDCDYGYALPFCAKPGFGPEVIDCDIIGHADRKFTSGMYNIELGRLRKKVTVYCDISPSTQDGWTYIMYRGTPGTISFNKGWIDYKNGFGIAGSDSEHFIGLEALYLLTKQRRYQLRVEMQNYGGMEYYAEYSRFAVESSAFNYRLTVEGYKGNAGDALGYHNKMEFSTPDQDHDKWYQGSCARDFRSGWWFNSCYKANLDGVYTLSGAACPDDICVQWRTINGYMEKSLRKVVMKIKPY